MGINTQLWSSDEIKGNETLMQISNLLPNATTKDKRYCIAALAETVRTNCIKSAVTVDEIKGLIIKATKLGLLVDGVESTLVQYGGQTAHVIQLAGYLKLLRKLPHFVDLNTAIVYEADAFTFNPTTQEIFHETDYFASEGEKGKAIGVYGVATTVKIVNGIPVKGKTIEIMSVNTINDKHRPPSAGDKSPWKKHPEEMYKKTMVGRLAKRLGAIAIDAEAIPETTTKNVNPNPNAGSSVEQKQNNSGFVKKTNQQTQVQEEINTGNNDYNFTEDQDQEEKQQGLLNEMGS